MFYWLIHFSNIISNGEQMNILTVFSIFLSINSIKESELPDYTVYIALDDCINSEFVKSQLSIIDWTKYARNKEERMFLFKIQSLRTRMLTNWKFKFVDKYDLSFPDHLDYFPAFKIGKYTKEWFCFPDIATRTSTHVIEYLMWEYDKWYLPFRRRDDTTFYPEEYEIFYAPPDVYRPSWLLSVDEIKKREKIMHMHKTWKFHNSLKKLENFGKWLVFGKRY